MPALRIALVADTHGEIDSRITALAVCCDHVVHAGDVGSFAVLQALQSGQGMLTAVTGNNDVVAKWPAGEFSLLAELPEQARLALPGGDLVVVHGHRHGRPNARHASLRREFPAARAVVYGHSHRRCIDRTAKPWIFNPGAAGRVRTYGGPSMLILTASAVSWRVGVKHFPAQTKP